MKLDSQKKLWNIILSIVFLFLFIIVGSLIWESYGNSLQIEVFEFILLALGTFRLIRLVVYDRVMLFFRELFPKDSKSLFGLKATIADLLGCPWCFGVWASLIAVTLYFLVPLGNLFIMLLALAGVATFIQITMNCIGWHAEGKKLEVQAKLK